MLQSSPAFIKCYECKRGPKQFSFLLCNHIICGKCISKNIQLSEKYNWVRCSCGCLTYFNQQNQIVDGMSINNGQNERKQYLNVSRDQQYENHTQELKMSQKNNKKRTTINHTTNKNIIIFPQTLLNKRQTLQSNISISQIFSLQSQNSQQQQCQNRNENHYHKQKEQHKSPLSQSQKQLRSYVSNNSNHITNHNIINSPSSSSSSLLRRMQQSKINNCYFIGTQNTTTINGQESLLLENYCTIKGQKKKNKSSRAEEFKVNNNKNNNNSRLINQFSTHYIFDDSNQKQQKQYHHQQQKNQTLSPKSKLVIIPNVKNIASSVTLPETTLSLKQQKSPIQTPKQQQSIISSQSSNNQNNSLQQKKQKLYHSRFQNQINFLGKMFKKDLQQVQYMFNNVLRQIKLIYKKFQKSLKSLYVEQVISNNYDDDDNQMFKINLTNMIKQRYQKDIAKRFNHIKDNLSSIFYTFRHNQKKLNSISKLSSHNHNHLHIHQLIHKNKLLTKNHYQTAQTLNNSQVIYQSDQDCCDQQSQTMKNKKVQRFQTVPQKLQRLTTKNNQQKIKSSKNHLNSFNSSINKRVQTQHVHTNVKSKVNLNFLQKENYDQGNCSIEQLTPQINYRLTQKPQRKSNPISVEKQTENKRRQIIYFSPPLPYCHKHLQKKQKQAKNYISYIEKLCHDKKMKNHQELFKKVKQNNQLYEFRNRE